MSNQSDAIKAPTYYQGVFTHDQITLSSRGEEARESLEPAKTSSLAAGGPLNLPRYVPKYSVKQRILGTLKSWRGSQEIPGKIDVERNEPVYAIPNKRSTRDINRGSSPEGKKGVSCCKCCALVTVVLLLFAVGGVGIGLGVYYGLFYTEQGTSSTSSAPNKTTTLRVSTSTKQRITSLPFANTVGAIATTVSGNLATTVASNAVVSATASTNNSSIVLTTNIAATLAAITNGVTLAETTIPTTSVVVGPTTRQPEASSVTDLSSQLPVATSNPTTLNNYALTTVQLRQSTSI